MPIRKRGKTWSVDIYLPNGKRHRETVGTKKEAKEKERELIAGIVNGTWAHREEDITFGEFLKDYYKHTEASKAKSTHMNDQYRIDAHLKKTFEHHILRNITPKMVDRYKAKRASGEFGQASKVIIYGEDEFLQEVFHTNEDDRQVGHKIY